MQRSASKLTLQLERMLAQVYYYGFGVSLLGIVTVTIRLADIKIQKVIIDFLYINILYCFLLYKKSLRQKRYTGRKTPLHVYYRKHQCKQIYP